MTRFENYSMYNVAFSRDQKLNSFLVSQWMASPSTTPTWRDLGAESQTETLTIATAETLVTDTDIM